MRSKRSFVRKLVLWTAGVACCAVLTIIGMGFWLQETVSTPLGEITLGSPQAPVEVLVVEDFLCKSCRLFHEELFPRIRDDFIRRGEVHYTLVPVALSRESQRLANAVLAMKSAQPALALPYITQLFTAFPLPLKNEVRAQNLLHIAQQVGLEDFHAFALCIDHHCNQDLLDTNLLWARQKMGKEFSLPAVYINGERTFIDSFDSMASSIDAISRVVQ